VRRLMHQLNQAVQFIFGQQHGGKRLAEFFHNPNADCSPCFFLDSGAFLNV